MKPNDDEKAPSPQSDDWDGITLQDRPLPRWWRWGALILGVWAVGYLIAYPALPLSEGATPGLLGYSSRGEVAASINRYDVQNAALNERLAKTPLSEIRADQALHDYAVNAGASVYKAACVQCHGAGAAGVQAKGYPNLIDDDWLWGGSLADIAFSINHGIRNQQSPLARNSQMPVFADLLPRQDIHDLTHHVRALGRLPHDNTAARHGAMLFSQNCASCHGANGTGNRALGAPDLTDTIWLYGQSHAEVQRSISGGRYGVMPAWGNAFRPGQGITPAQIAAVTLYVHQLGGGE